MAQDNHAMVRELARHEAKVLEVRKRAQHWRLTDCSTETLANMRQSLIKNMVELEASLAEGDELLSQCIEAGDPLATEQSIENINRISAEWTSLNVHLQEIDDAWLERRLKTRLLDILGSERRLYFLEFFIFICILIAVTITIAELFVPSVSVITNETLLIVDTVFAVILLSDFLFRLYLSEDRRWYMGKYWIDFVASIPFSGVLRFGRVFRLARFVGLLRLLRLGRAMRVISFTFRGFDQLIQTLQFNLLKRALLIATALLLLGAFTIRAMEQNVVPNNEATPVSELDDSLWWSFTTVATGGFADLYNPQSIGGRFLTVALVLLGFVVTSIFTASLTSILVDDDSTRLEQNQHALEKQLDGLQGQLNLMSRESNTGLIVLETIAQKLSNVSSMQGLFNIVTNAMTHDFEALQASIHLIENDALTLRAHLGLEQAKPDQTVQIGEQFLGKTVAELLKADLGAIDIEPITMPAAHLRAIRLLLPLVANKQLLGLVHIVLPENLGRYYLYNRAPMTLTHHAAIATYAFQSQTSK